MFKYELDQVIYYFIDNKVHSAPVLSRCIIENLHEDWITNKTQYSTFAAFGKSGVMYSTCHSTLNEYEVFASKEDLLESL